MKEQLAKLNALARKFYSRHGYEVPEGYDFSTANHPQELLMFALAVDAYNFIEESRKNETDRN